jgi:hypothetical protein
VYHSGKINRLIIDIKLIFLILKRRRSNLAWQYSLI